MALVLLTVQDRQPADIIATIADIEAQTEGSDLEAKLAALEAASANVEVVGEQGESLALVAHEAVEGWLDWLD